MANIIEEDKENNVNSYNKEQRGLHDFKKASLLFVPHLNSEDEDDDDEITFRPSASKREAPIPKVLSEASQHKEHVLSPAPSSLTLSSVGSQTLTESASRFEQVSARLDEWKKAMGGFHNPSTVVEPTPVPSVDSTSISEANDSMQEVEGLVFAFAPADTQKPRKRPPFVPGRHSRQLQEARAAKKALEAQQTKVDQEDTSLLAQRTESEQAIEPLPPSTVHEVIQVPVVVPVDGDGELEREDATTFSLHQCEGLEPSVSVSSILSEPEELQPQTTEELGGDFEVEEQPEQFLPSCSLASIPQFEECIDQFEDVVSSPSIEEALPSSLPVVTDEFCIPCTPVAAEKLKVKSEPATEEIVLLRERIASLTSTNRHLENVIRGYEETFEQLVREEQQKYEEEQRLRLALQEKNKELLEDMAEITHSFEQMKMRYEEYKSSNEVLQQQLEGLQRVTEETEGALREAEAGQEAWSARFDALKLHAQERLAAANAEIEVLQHSNQAKEEALCHLRKRQEALELSQRKQLAAGEGRHQIAQSRIAALEKERNELLLICDQLMSSLESPPPLPTSNGSDN